MKLTVVRGLNGFGATLISCVATGLVGTVVVTSFHGGPQRPLRMMTLLATSGQTSTDGGRVDVGNDVVGIAVAEALHHVTITEVLNDRIRDIDLCPVLVRPVASFGSYTCGFRRRRGVAGRERPEVTALFRQSDRTFAHPNDGTGEDDAPVSAIDDCAGTPIIRLRETKR